MSLENKEIEKEDGSNSVSKTAPNETVEYDASMLLSVNKLHVFDDVLNLR